MARNSSIKKWVMRIALILVGLLGGLFLADRILGLTSGKGGEDNYWIAKNDSINLANKAFADQNPYGFTDTLHSFAREGQKVRIAVLGDSFVWGDGLPYTQTWPHKLGQKMQERFGKRVEVLPWGKNGWETVDHLKFYQEEGQKFEIDVLLVGFVENDYDLGRYEEPDWNYRENNAFMYKLFPNVAEKLLGDQYNREYQAFQQKNRSSENLQEWRKKVRELVQLASGRGAKVSYILTPNCLYPNCVDPHNKADSLLSEMGVSHLNLIPAFEEKYADKSSDELNASPVNGHPGPLLTELFAAMTLEFMLQEYDTLFLQDSL